ncbi:MAG: DUF393 domain-containing protein [Thermaerobacter sp.]|nr:DUF393 domain-containing protein [Thermaerobacter sp.]
MADAEQLTVYYDGTCPICTSAADGWRKDADACGLVLLPLQDAQEPPDGPTKQQLLTAIHVQGPDGWLRGAKALRAVYRRLGNWPMTLLLTLGIAFGIADPLYRLVARYRMHLPVPRRGKPHG